ncbi:MAG: rhamnogalacturonan lyase [Opitutaceae bacterium]
MKFLAYFFRTAVLCTAFFACLENAPAQRVMESLGRGVVAIPQADGTVFVSWRLLGTDADDLSFNLYRSAAGGTAAKLNAQPLTGPTHFVDTAANLTVENVYTLRSVVNGREAGMSAPFLGRIAANAPVRQYIEIPLSLPAGTNPNDASVGDLDGDGEYEIVLKGEQRPRDTASTGLTGETVLQGYKLDGTLLWTINLGKNVREGAHDTQFMVADLDGDGIAEIACRTADGTIDGKGKVIGDATADWRDQKQGSRTFGRIVTGPEYFTIFDGRTGAELASTAYIPERGDLSGWGGIGGNGGNDNVGNRANRFLACVAYLDGKLPSVVMCRGYYGRSVLAAWDWRGGKLTSRWVFDTNAEGTGKDGKPNKDYAGMGAHGISVADVDGDGKDEIVYNSMVVDDDGRGLFTTGLRHGDALHVGDLDPSRPGIEVFGVHENENETAKFGTPGTASYDARTGEVIWSNAPGADVGRGLSADIDPRHVGEEMWGGPGGLRTAKGLEIGARPQSQNFAIWWDGDLLRELLDSNRVMKWDWEKGTVSNLLVAEGASSNNGSKSTPALSVDLFGDWREELILRSSDNKSLRIYTTTIPTDYRMTTLMHDPQYRLSIAWQNVAYNQPPHPGFFLGNGMKLPIPRANITVPAIRR